MVDENKITMDTQNQEISNYIEQLKGGLIYYSNIPEEYRLHSAIVSAERELGIRKSIRKGYDIIKNTFFVEEIILNKNWHDDIIENVITTLFVDFVTYYEFLQGDIYENACYYKYDFTQDEIVHYSIDIDKINFKALIDYTIDEFTLDFTQDEIKHYKFIEKRKSELKKWIAKFDSCNTYAEFKKILNKNGFYMFILQYSNGNLSILNGGAVKRLAHKAVYYYYENMDKVISYIKTPLDNFSNYQKQIAEEIKTIGGSGNIHGAIIDIDFFNHIYVNPVDLNVTAYWASDIINKVVFDDTPALLKSNCPDIYANYLKQIESNSNAALILNNSSIVRPPQFYLDTDIYRASREIKKMQKLSSNILSIWIEPERKKLSDNND